MFLHGRSPTVRGPATAGPADDNTGEPRGRRSTQIPVGWSTYVVSTPHSETSDPRLRTPNVSVA